MQADLFQIAGETTPESAQTKKFSFLDRYRFTVRLDQALIGMIVLIMAYVLIFSFGVEKGKRFAMSEIRAERAKREVMVDELKEKLEKKVFIGEEAVLIENATLPQAKAPATKIDETKSVLQKELKPSLQAGEKPSGKFTIQLITYTDKPAAQQAVQTLVKKGFQGFIIPSGKYQQVCVNGFDDRGLANKLLGQLKDQGVAPKDAYVRPM